MKTAYLKVIIDSDAPYDFGRLIKCHYPGGPVMEVNFADIKDISVTAEIPSDIVEYLNNSKIAYVSSEGERKTQEVLEKLRNCIVDAPTFHKLSGK